MTSVYGPTIRDLRRRKGLSLEVLARRSGVAARTIRAIENGETPNPQPATIKALAGALGADPESLFRQAPIATSPPVQIQKPRCGLLVIRTAGGQVVGHRSLHDEEFTVGRSEQNSVTLLDRSVSLYHAAFSVRSSDVAVRDLGSTNGTWTRGRRIQDRTLLHFAEPVGIGSYLLEIHSPSVRLEDLPAAYTDRLETTPKPSR